MSSNANRASPRLRQVDIKAEQLERQVQHLEQEKDMVEKKYEVRSKSSLISFLSVLIFPSGGGREIQEGQGWSWWTCCFYGGPLIIDSLVYLHGPFLFDIRLFTSSFLCNEMQLQWIRSNYRPQEYQLRYLGSCDLTQRRPHEPQPIQGLMSVSNLSTSH